MRNKDPQKKTLLERRWSAITSATNLRRKKRESFMYQPNESLNCSKADYVRVSKSEYEDIKHRVLAIEKRLSFELDNMQSTVIHNEVNIIHDIQSAYEQTLEHTEPMSPGTDQLARRLSRDLRIRDSRDKVIRSPSARKIGNIRRRSRELERPSKIPKISSVQNISTDINRTGFARSISSPIRSKAFGNQLQLHTNTIVTLKSSTGSYDVESKDLISRHVDDKIAVKGNESRKQRSLKRSTSTTSSFNYSPSKYRMINFSPRRSLELDPFDYNNKENDVDMCTPKMPQIKRAIPVSRTPKRLCITPCRSRINTPLKVLPNNYKTPNF